MKNPLRKSNRLLTRCLLAGILIELSVFTGVCAAPYLQDRLPRALLPNDDSLAVVTRWRRTLYRPVADPRLGSPAPAGDLRTENGEPFDLSRLHGRPVALLFARDGCACSTKALTEAWSGLRKGHPERVVVVATPKLDHAVLTWAEQTAHVRVLLDAGRETAHQYNAWWFPRAYALDEQGRVTYVQPDTTGDPWAPLQVAALWGEGR